MTDATETDSYFQGDALYGDDFDEIGLARWWQDEEDGYADLIDEDGVDRPYGYHLLNQILYYRRFPTPSNSIALGLGSALGNELLPLAPMLCKAVIIDSSDHFRHNHVLKGVEVTYLKAQLNGLINLPDNSVDRITCFGVLHHIANVSTVLGECHRVLKPGGLMFCREPIVSQGDWRQPRPGLTKNERGIPLGVFRQIIGKVGFAIEREQLFDFSPFGKLIGRLSVSMYQNRFATAIDLTLARLFSFNTTYHRAGLWQKIGPASVSYVLSKTITTPHL